MHTFGRLGNGNPIPHPAARRLLVVLTIWLLFAGLAGMLALSTGCARVPATSTTPGRPATAYENVLVWNASVANSNLAVAQGFINANAATPPAVSDDLTRRMLDECARIAQANRQLTLILQSGPDGVKAGAATVRDLLTQIRIAGQNLVATGTVGITNPQTQTVVRAQIDGIMVFAQQIADALLGMGLL